MSSRSDYPVVIVGAGPAGSAAAFILARKGLRPLLAERFTFPREKVCGDGLTFRSLSTLKELNLYDRVSSHPSALPVKEARAVTPEKTVFSGPIPLLPDGTVGFISLPRRELDLILARAAVEAGAEFAEDFTVTEILKENGKTAGVAGIQEGRERIVRSNLVIGADGAHSIVAREAGLYRFRRHFCEVAIRAYFTDLDEPVNWLELYYDKRIIPGFAWLFPLANNICNIGIGLRMDRLKKRSLKTIYQEFISDYPPLKKRLKKAKMLAHPRGTLITGYGNSGNIFSDGVLLAGDAASLSDPLVGEGVGEALLSGVAAGETAARAISAGDFSGSFLKQYQKEIRRRLGPDFRFASLFQNWPQIHKAAAAMMLRAERDPEFAQKMVGLASGAISKREIARWDFLAPTVWGYWMEKIKKL